MQINVDITQWGESDFLTKVVQAAADRLFNEMRQAAMESVREIVRNEYGAQLREAVKEALAGAGGIPRKVDGAWETVSLQDFVEAYLRGEVGDYQRRPRVEKLLEEIIDRQMPVLLGAFTQTHRDQLLESASRRVGEMITERLR